MLLCDIQKLLDAEILACHDGLNIDVEGIKASDLMSDVLTMNDSGVLLLTGLTNVQAVRTAAADRFINLLPDTYATVVSEKGSNFSRGERQLLSFARALAFNPEILVLDEATSSVDPETERTIQASLRKLQAGRTSLVIAHRLSTILDADRILVIRQGEIVERGTHSELLLMNGYYTKLFHLQFKNKNGVIANA